MKNFFKDKTILVTGANGSIGSEILNALLSKKCKVIRAMSNDENGLFSLSQKINKKKENLEIHMLKNKIRYFYGDICNADRCREAIKDVDIVIHAAALKHLPLCEFNPYEAVNVNVLGTKNLIKASIYENIEKFLFISTDKVVDATSVLGSTKLLAERMVLNSNYVKGKSRTLFSCIRFGNIMGSRGSVLPTFIEQAKSESNITLSDKKMKRCFVTIKVAIDAILNSIKNMKGGEIFLPSNMVSLKIDDVAKVIKKIFKSKSKILITGKKEGEKLEEKILFDEEIERAKHVKNLIIIKDNYKKNKLGCGIINKIYLPKDNKFVFKYIKNVLGNKTLLNKI